MFAKVVFEFSVQLQGLVTCRFAQAGLLHELFNSSVSGQMSCAAIKERVQVVKTDRAPIEQARQAPRDGAFSRAAIPDEYQVHSRASITSRMTSAGACWPVHVSNCTMA